jgi:uncharacterized iron-regulated membrane protein
MKGIYLNKLHRYVGITLAPFLVIQALSGLFLDFGLFRRGAGGAGERGAFHAEGIFDTLLVKTHFGPGLGSDIYHLLMGIAVVWMALSGWLLFLRIRRVQMRSGKQGKARVEK